MIKENNKITIEQLESLREMLISDDWDNTQFAIDVLSNNPCEIDIKHVFIMVLAIRFAVWCFADGWEFERTYYSIYRKEVDIIQEKFPQLFLEATEYIQYFQDAKDSDSNEWGVQIIKKIIKDAYTKEIGGGIYT